MVIDMFIVNSNLDSFTDRRASLFFFFPKDVVFQAENHLKVLHNDANDFNVILALHFPAALFCALHKHDEFRQFHLRSSTCLPLTYGIVNDLVQAGQEGIKGKGIRNAQ